MKLEFEGEGNYGIPYNIEGYGLIANKKMLTDILELGDIEQFKQDYKAASYTEFQDMVKSLDSYIKNGSGEDFTLNGKSYHIRNGKTPYTESLTGVLAIAGAEKWTYGNHYGNFPISAVYKTVYDVRESASERTHHQVIKRAGMCHRLLNRRRLSHLAWRTVYQFHCYRLRPGHPDAGGEKGYFHEKR